MKMTPEQESFYELGAVKAFLFNKIEEARSYARQFYGKSYCELIRKEREDCWKHSEINFFIKLVRERRAACRAWVHPMRRRCSNCKYELTQYKWCTVCANEGLPIYWEPRKETKKWA